MKGIHNYSSNCFINSTIQALFNCNTFNRIILETLQEDKSIYDENPLVSGYCNLVFQNNNQAISTIDPLEFLKIVETKRPDFKQESDAHDFLFWFTDEMHKCMKYEDMFTGKDNIKIVYKCGHQPTEPIIQHSKGYFIKDNKTKIEDQLIASKTKSEFTCQQCNQQTIQTQLRNVDAFPKVICLHFRKFGGEIPLKLFNAYHLKSLVVYTGNIKSGHYVALIRTGESTWVSCDDKSVRDFSKLHELFHLVEYALFEAE